MSVIYAVNSIKYLYCLLSFMVLILKPVGPWWCFSGFFISISFPFGFLDPLFLIFFIFPVGNNRIFLVSVSQHYALTWKINKIWENFLSGIHFWTFLKMSIFKNSPNFFPKKKIVYSESLESHTNIFIRFFTSVSAMWISF